MVLREIPMPSAKRESLVVHEDDISRFDGCIRTHGTHGDAYVGADERWCIVDAIAHEGNFLTFGCFVEITAQEINLAFGSRPA